MTTASEQFPFDTFSTILDDLGDAVSSEWEEEFYDSIREKFDEYGDDMFLRNRQAAVIEKIIGK